MFRNCGRKDQLPYLVCLVGSGKDQERVVLLEHGTFPGDELVLAFSDKDDKGARGQAEVHDLPADDRRFVRDHMSEPVARVKMC